MTRLPVVLLLLLLCACDQSALSFRVLHVKVAHDGFEVLDAALMDADGDGDQDVVVATEQDVRLLVHEAGAWRDGSPGAGFGAVAKVERLHADGRDLVLERGGRVRRLVGSAVGTWTEAEADEPGPAPAPILAVELDLDGDGVPERARLDGRRLIVEANDGSGWRDVTVATGADGLTLPAPGTRLLTGDLDGDGHADLLAVGSRLFALLSNGGALPAARGASVADLGDGGAPAAPTMRGPWFTDVSAEAGLSVRHVEGDEQWDIRPTMGPGACFGDIDGDGDPDLYVVGGSEQHGWLFRNDGTGRFVECSSAWGLNDVPQGAGMGALFADWDEDGDPDLYVTRDGENLLFRNDGEGFTDVTAASGTGDGRWGAGIATADTDRDGDLDLYVTNYLAFDPSVLPPEEQRREDPLAMLPYVFDGQANVMYRNDGALRFADVTEAVGLLDPSGKSLGALFLDQDQDGWPDLYVANDTTPNTFHHNRGDGRFEEISLLVGVDDPRGGMGLAAADLDSDGDEDLLLTNWQLEPNALYRNNREHGTTQRRFVPEFEDVAVLAGLAQPSVGYVGWGCLLADLDGDADHDVFVVNGYTSPDYETTMRCVGQQDHLFENVSGPGPFPEHRTMPRFTLAPASRAGDWARALDPGRGLAAADTDGDGDLDLLITNNNGAISHLRNERGGRFLHVVPEGRAPRDAVGARVTVELDDGRQPVAVVRAGAGYLGGHERGVRFGLAGASATAVEVVWPDGERSRHETPTAGRVVVIQPR
jgi:hypothetical protein